MKLAAVTRTLLKSLRSHFRHRKLVRNQVLDFSPVRRWIMESSRTDSQLQDRMNRYALTGLYLAECLSSLHHQAMSGEEESRVIHYCAALPVFEGFFRVAAPDYSRILRLINHPEIIVPETPEETLFIQLLTEIYRTVPDQTLFRSWLMKLFDAERDHLWQQSDSITQPDIERLSWERAAYSMLALRSLIDRQILYGEEMAIFQLAGTLRLLEDILDIHQDFQNGWQTLATRSPNSRSLRIRLGTEIRKTRTAFSGLTINPVLAGEFFTMLSPVWGFGFVCLDQYEDVQGRARELNLARIPAKKLTCNPESLPILLKTVRQILKQIPG
ncbi:MAG: hypothetical protein L6Q77_06790 [Bacteroidetes bacterium]|nr:hypothetical protein [Bacteroidota bacterium]